MSTVILCNSCKLKSAETERGLMSTFIVVGFLRWEDLYIVRGSTIVSKVHVVDGREYPPPIRSNKSIQNTSPIQLTKFPVTFRGDRKTLVGTFYRRFNSREYRSVATKVYWKLCYYNLDSSMCGNNSLYSIDESRYDGYPTSIRCYIVAWEPCSRRCRGLSLQVVVTRS